MIGLREICLFSLVVASVTACDRAQMHKRVQNVVVITYASSNGCDIVNANSDSLIGQWEQCFPRYNELPASPPAAGFYTKYRVFFCLGNGMAFEVNTDGTNWYNGNGTFAVGRNVDDVYKATLAEIEWAKRFCSEEEARFKDQAYVAPDGKGPVDVSTHSNTRTQVVDRLSTRVNSGAHSRADKPTLDE